MQHNLLVDRKALASRLGISTTTVKKMVTDGDLPRPRFGRFFYWPAIVAAMEGSPATAVDEDRTPLPRFLAKGARS